MDGVFLFLFLGSIDSLLAGESTGCGGVNGISCKTCNYFYGSLDNMKLTNILIVVEIANRRHTRQKATMVSHSTRIGVLPRRPAGCQYQLEILEVSLMDHAYRAE